MTKDSIRIAHVTANEPPESVKTLADWLVWRAQEDVRMEMEMTRQRESYFAGLEIIAARDANGESQH